MHAVVVGGGPVGALTAVHLADQGWNVTVFERSATMPGPPGREDTRAYTLSLGPRGLVPLQAAGMDLSALAATANGWFGMQTFGPSGKPDMSVKLPVDPNKPQRMLVYRDVLSRHILDEMKRLQPSIRLQLNSRVTQVKLDQQQVVVRCGDRSEEVHEYDLLVGADGANSCIRTALAAAMPPGFCRQRAADAEYAALSLPPALQGGDTHCAIERHQFEAGLILVSDPGSGDRRACPVLPTSWAARVREDCTALDPFLDGPQHLPALSKEVKAHVKAALREQPAFTPVSQWTMLSQLVGPKVVLLGDAAHSMSPTLGQACNCGLEDAHVFAGILQRHGKDVDGALKAFNAERLPNVNALLTLNLVASARLQILTKDQSFREAAWVSSMKVLLSLASMCQGIAHKLAPAMFPPPTMMRCVIGSVPYRQAMRDAYSSVAALIALCALPALLSLWTRL